LEALARAQRQRPRAPANSKPVAVDLGAVARRRLLELRQPLVAAGARRIALLSAALERLLLVAAVRLPTLLVLQLAAVARRRRQVRRRMHRAQ
jgi:hypothetical protein